LALLVRTWNVFHGNAVPPERRAYLKEMVELATTDSPDALCLQEVPVWALSKLEGWSGMQSFGVVASRPKLGSAELGKWITELDNGLFRSAFTGQANAILVARGLRPVGEDSIVLNPRSFRRAEAKKLGLDFRTRLGWGLERRVCQAVRVETEGRFVSIANLHASRVDPRCADVELQRSVDFAESFVQDGDTLVVAGDFNVGAESSQTLKSLEGYSEPIPGIDQVLVGGAEALGTEKWPPARRTVDGRLLSDHAPVETRFE
jgi:endonuclease/exonuclease/phosphatase family metal-dependent hydrolase